MKAFRSLALAAIALTTLLAGCERPPVDMVQRGFRGTGMAQVYNPRTVDAQLALHQAPEAIPPAEPGGPAGSTVYQNVQVLGDLSVAEFTRTMVAMTAWVAPKEGCAYCHAGANFASDEKYAKVVARRMLQMTKHLNTDWKDHVAETGVTCYTCHRGQPVPAKIWFKDPGPKTAAGPAGTRAGQNAPATSVALSSLPFDPFTPFLQEENSIRVAGTTALPEGNRQSTKQTEWTYGLMMHFSDSLGVNCTYCHNSRAFSDWNQSPPQRATAWHGIRMVRDLNNAYLEPLGPTYPKERLGVTGDAPKAYCATCHQGAYKPLYGAAMAKDYPALYGAVPAKVAEKK
jgi:photosynthetic reaction center cytochrome c subunit